MATDMEQVHMLLDVDTGVDDALALLLALRCPRIKVLAITCVNGNVNVDQVVKNTLRVLDVAEAPMDLLVARGFDRPLVEPPHAASYVHGEDGLGGLQPPLPESSRTPHEEHAVQVILKTLRAALVPVVVVSLGPLTNIAVAIRTEPAIWHEKCARLVWMGGAVSIGGNKSAWAEFNASADPEAAHIVISSGIPVLMYPWDVFLKPTFSRDELDELDSMRLGSEGQPWTLLADRLLRSLMRVFSSDSSTIGDAGAVAAAILPDALTVKQFHVDMELAGAKTRGMTVCDMRSSNLAEEKSRPGSIGVVMDLDADAIKMLFKQHVLSIIDDAVDASVRGKTNDSEQRGRL